MDLASGFQRNGSNDCHSSNSYDAEAYPRWDKGAVILLTPRQQCSRGQARDSGHLTDRSATCTPHFGWMHGFLDAQVCRALSDRTVCRLRTACFDTSKITTCLVSCSSRK